jgi:hypothetical protein
MAYYIQSTSISSTTLPISDCLFPYSEPAKTPYSSSLTMNHQNKTDTLLVILGKDLPNVKLCQFSSVNVNTKQAHHLLDPNFLGWLGYFVTSKFYFFRHNKN